MAAVDDDLKHLDLAIQGSTSTVDVIDILDGAVIEVIDPRLSAIHVEPNSGEEDDSNIPKNLHNAAELFIQAGKTTAAQQMQRCTAVFFALVEGRCKADNTSIGRACVCWQCGHCGLGRSPETASRTCSSCGEKSQTNYVQVVLADGVAIPWREINSSPSVSASLVCSAVDATGEDSEGHQLAKDAQEAKRAAITKAVKAAKEAQQASELLNLDQRLQSIQVIANPGEDEHPRFPKTLYNALELMLQVGQVSAARQLHKCSNEYLRVLDEGPQAAGDVGQGYVCFSCGYCGLAPELDEKSSDKACSCRECGDDSHTNLVQLVLPNGRELPWMQSASTSMPTSLGNLADQKTAGRIKPNGPCNCGSGKKAKKCCFVGGG